MKKMDWLYWLDVNPGISTERGNETINEPNKTPVQQNSGKSVHMEEQTPQG